MLKRIAACFLSIVLLAALSVTAYAAQPESMETLEKTYTLRISETYGAIEANPMAPAFWEYPFLRAGETYAEGTLKVVNTSEYTASMSLAEVMLPYGDDAKLDYLNHLQLTVKEGDTVLFDDIYARVNDAEGGLKIAFDAMAPGEEHVYKIKLRCHYDYKGDPYTDAAQMAWVFNAKTQTTPTDPTQTDGLAPWVQTLIFGGAATAVLLVLTFIVYGIIVAVKKNKEKRVDNTQEV